MVYFKSIFTFFYIIFFFSFITNCNSDNILFEKKARVYNFDYNSDYGFVFGDYAKIGSINIIETLTPLYKISKKLNYGLEDKEKIYFNFVHTVKWIDKDNLFFIKTKSDDGKGQGGFYKLNLKTKKVKRLDNFFKNKKLKTFPVNIGINKDQYIFIYMSINTVLFVNKQDFKVEKIISNLPIKDYLLKDHISKSLNFINFELNRPHDIYIYDQDNFMITDTGSGNIYFFKNNIPYSLKFLSRKKAIWEKYRSGKGDLNKSIVTIKERQGVIFFKQISLNKIYTFNYTDSLQNEFLVKTIEIDKNNTKHKGHDFNFFKKGIITNSSSDNFMIYYKYFKKDD